MTTSVLRMLGTPLAALGLALTVWSPAPANAATTINLGTAASFSVLAGTTVTNTGPSTIAGDVGVSPGTALTGFGTATVAGTQHSADGVADQAQADLTAAYTTAAGEPTTGNVSADLGGQTLAPGVYTGPTLGLTGTLTLDAANDPNAIFVFQSASTLTTASTSAVALTRGANPCNVYWQVGSSATLGSNSVFTGSLLALTSITATTGAKVLGRLLARNGATTLDSNTITAPNCNAVLTTPTPTATATATASPTTTPTPTASASTTASATPSPSATTQPATPTTTPPTGPTSATSVPSASTPAAAGQPRAAGGSGGFRRATASTRPAALAFTGFPAGKVAALAMLTLAAGLLLLLLSAYPTRRRS